MRKIGTCVWRTAAQWRLPGKKRFSTQEKLDFAIALLFSKRKSEQPVIADPVEMKLSIFPSRRIVSSSPLLCTDLDLSLLYILISATYSKFARRLLSAALLERWLQVCRVKITFTRLPTNRFLSTTKISMKCVVNWIPLRIRVRSRNTQPHLN